MKKVLEFELKTREKIKIIFRHVKKSDVKGVWNNFNEVLKEAVFLPVLTPVETDWEKRVWFDNLKKENEMCIVAENPDLKAPEHIVGQCELSNLQWEAATHVFSLGIIIRKEFRDLGIGRAMIDFAIYESKRIYNKEKIILSCFSSNNRGLYLYESMGFKKIGIRKNQFYMNSEYYDEVLFEIFLDEYLKNHQ
ncbi:MAG: GNAT family N-acetyltransferase [Promethearchaeota archaeon]